MDEFELELKQDFLQESDDLLDQAEEAFLALESRRDDDDLINEIFRLAHNLKGTSKAVGFDELAALTHVAENLILKVKEKTIEVSDPIVTVLLEFKDKVQEMIAGLKSDVEATFDTEELKQKLANITEGQVDEPAVTSESEEGGSFFEETPITEDTPSEDVEAVEEASQPSQEAPALSSAALESMKELGIPIPEASVEAEMKEPAVAKEPVKPPAPAKSEAPKAASPSKKKVESDESIRVSLKRIDDLT